MEATPVANCTVTRPHPRPLSEGEGACGKDSWQPT
jgi:hypothetical protein